MKFVKPLAIAALSIVALMPAKAASTAMKFQVKLSCTVMCI
jgi:hypothetical protein